MEKAKVKDQIINIIIDNLEKGVIPWEKGWSERLHRPYNPITNTVYKGYNSLFLYIMQTVLAKDNNTEYEDPRWLTFVNARNSGFQIRKNEHGTPIEYFQKSLVNDDNDEKDTDEAKNKYKTIVKNYTVFNFTQLHGYGTDKIPAYKPQTYKWSTDEELDKMISKIDVSIKFCGKHEGSYYKINNDIICLPNKEQFKTSDDYYATLLHEIIHWTGHKSRLNRNISGMKDDKYAFEELVAEIGSLYLKERIGLKNDAKIINNSSSYIDTWIKVLKDDRNNLFLALKKADEAVEYISKMIGISDKADKEVKI
jgi:antirestriction protein ArdC